MSVAFFVAFACVGAFIRGALFAYAIRRDHQLQQAANIAAVAYKLSGGSR